MHCLLVAGGVLASPTLLLEKISPDTYDCIIAVDRGYDHCMTLGLTPDILMGDMDSIHTAPLAAPTQQGDGNPTACTCEIITFPPEKDDTDLRLAVDYALNHDASSIDMICATGGRLDQFMGNVSLLEFLQEKAPATPVRMLDEGNVIRLLVAQDATARTPQDAAQNKVARTALTHYPRRSKYISLIPISERICFSGEGLKYPAQHLTVHRTHMISISNEALGDDYAIALHSGKALLIEAD